MIRGHDQQEGQNSMLEEHARMLTCEMVGFQVQVFKVGQACQS